LISAGILNSKLINYLFQRKYVDINVKGIYLKEIPIKQIDFESHIDMHYSKNVVELIDKQEREIVNASL
jgi:hypothetical protein